jgi:hypothetical protein
MSDAGGSHTALKDFLPIIGVAIGAILSWAGQYIQKRMQRGDENRKAIREKLQEALLLCYDFERWLDDMMDNARQAAGLPESESPAEKIEAIVQAYGSLPTKDVESFMKCYQSFSEPCEDYCLGIRSGAATQIVEDLESSYDAARDASRHLRSSITAQIRKLVS